MSFSILVGIFDDFEIFANMQKCVTYNQVTFSISSLRFGFRSSTITKKLFRPRNDWHKRSPAASTLQLKSCHSSYLTYSEHTVTKHVQVLEDARLNGFSPSVHPEYQVSVRLGLLAAGRTDERTVVMPPP